MRLVAFGSSCNGASGHGVLEIQMGHVIDFLREYLVDHWEAFHGAQFKDPALGILATMVKAARGAERSGQGIVKP